MRLFTALPVLILASFLPMSALANALEEEIGRSEVRISAAPFALEPGLTIEGAVLLERLERLRYTRISHKPERPGTFFWSKETLWIFRRAFRAGGKELPARLLALDLQLAGKRHWIKAVRSADGQPLDARAARLEEEVIAESLKGDRAERMPIVLAQLPERIWRPLLAAEDARFFEHSGIDGRSLARALIKNVLAGKVKEGGSTITQQLIKNRDLSPARTVGRKASEALRALALEGEFTKEQILEAYLNQVYLGHVDGLAIHGYGAAARAYFDKNAVDLRLSEAALLAALVQGPNRLAPDRHAEAARERRNWVLGRMGELGWAKPLEVAQAKGEPIKLKRGRLVRPLGRQLVGWIGEIAAAEGIESGRGVIAETTLDALLQAAAEEEVEQGLARLRQNHRALKNVPLEAALIAFDARDGAILAYVGGDPNRATELDRVRKAKRQPGSALKPLILLEAFESCGDQKPLHPATRLADSAVEISLPKGAWRPENNDGKFRGIVSVRVALRESLNVPFVRLARHCGFEAVAARLRQSGLAIPNPAPPAFVLGALETTPLELATAYSALAGSGQRTTPRPLNRLEKPGGRALESFHSADRRVASAATAYLVRDLLRDAARSGTARAAALGELESAAKTGTSSNRRDAWLAGFSGALVVVLWVGRDDGAPLGLTGAEAAAPIWKRFMARAVLTRPNEKVAVPAQIVERTIDPTTGLLVRAGHERAQPEIFRRGHLPPRDLIFWFDDPAPVIK